MCWTTRFLLKKSFADGHVDQSSAKIFFFRNAFADGHLSRPLAKILCRWPSQAVDKEIFFLFFSSHFFLGASYTKYNPPSKVGTILSF
jgi:hypothetical protein